VPLVDFHSEGTNDLCTEFRIC